MKLNTDLIRELLIYIEENSDGKNRIHDIQIRGYTEDEIEYHTEVLVEAGYVLGEYISIMGKGRYLAPVRLTLAGHSYLENIRNKYIWAEVKKNMEIKGVKATSLDIIKDFANNFIRKKLDI